MIKAKWKFGIGDLVFHSKMGSGIVENRRMQSYHVMDRPVKIIEKELYSVLFGSDECLMSAEASDLEAVSREE